MTLTIEALRGVWRAQVDSRTFFADTLEELLLILAPDAPEEYVWNAAEVLGTILGAEVVELSRNEDENTVFGIPIDWLITSDEDERQTGWTREEAAALNKFHESWHPTEAQQTYFEQKPRSLVDELLEERREEAARENEEDPGSYPRGV